MSWVIVLFFAALVPVHSLRDDSEAEGMTQVSVSPKHFQLTSSKEKNQGMGNTALAQLGAKLQTENTRLKSIDAHTASLARMKDMQGNATEVMHGFSMKGECSCNLYTGMKPRESYGSVTPRSLMRAEIKAATVIAKVAIVKRALTARAYDKTLGKCEEGAKDVALCEKRVTTMEGALKNAKFENGRHNYENEHWILELTTENPSKSILWDFESDGLRMQVCDDHEAMRTAEWGTTECAGQTLGAGAFTKGSAALGWHLDLKSKPSFNKFVEEHMDQYYKNAWWYSLTKNNCQDFARERFEALSDLDQQWKAAEELG